MSAGQSTCEQGYCCLTRGHDGPHDSMGYTRESLLRWMLEHAEQRDSNAGPRDRTVALKFSRGTLRTWSGRVREALSVAP